MIFTRCVKGHCWPSRSRLLRIMKLVIFLTSVLTFQAFSESNAQKITLNAKNTTLREVMKEIQKQQGYSFLFRGDNIADTRVDVQLKQVDFPEAMRMILHGHGLDWTLKNGIITVKYLAEKDAVKSAQQINISGKVTDEDGSPLLGVTVAVKGNTQIGTISDADGLYSLSDLPKNAVLIYRYVGYVDQEVVVGNQTSIDVTLVVDQADLDEVVVVGFGTQSKRNVTSAISSVSASEIENYPVLQVGQAIQGKVAGAQIIQNSGSPGSSLTIRIRGAGTVNNGAPLYVVDGNLGVDPRDLDPNHIASIEVLKSASAAAIYGAQGANGVILVTTKSGAVGKISTDLNYYTGIQEVQNVLPLANGQEYAMLYNKALTNANRDPLFTDVENIGIGTDWQQEIFRTAAVHSADLSISGGAEHGKFYLSGSYFNQEGIVLNSDYERFAFRVNSEYKVTPRISVGENISLSYGVRNAIPEFGSRNPVPNAWHMDPTTPVRNSDGSWGFPAFSDTKNPVAEILLYNNTVKRPVLNGTVFVNADLSQTLMFRTQFNMNYGMANAYTFTPTYDIFPLQRNLVSNLTRTDDQWTNWDWQNTLTYQNQIGYHDLEVLGGMTFMRNRTESISAYGQGLPENANFDPNLRFLDLARDGNLVTGNAGDYDMLSFLGRVNYNYRGTYLLTVNFRADGSSKFGINNRFGYFPSFSLGWRISDEPFMRGANFVNDLKLRGGWGMLGNQNSLPNYAFANTVSQNLVYVFGDNVQQGQAATSLGNDELKWESTHETDIGIDFVGFQHQLSISVGFYDKKTKDMLLQVPVPSYLGLQTPPFVNGGDVRNRGIEALVGYHKHSVEGLSYDLLVNFSKNINEVTRLSNLQAALFSGNYSRTTVGYPIGSFYGYVMDGLFQTEEEIANHAFQAPGTSPGDIRYRDLNHDNVIDQDDRTAIGNPWPSFMYGVDASLRWRQFDVNVAVQGVQGNEIIADWKYFTQGSNFYNYDKDMFRAWDGPGTSNSIPRLNVNDPNNNMRASSYFVEDGSYLRVKNIQVGYTFPVDRLRINRLRVYLSAQNLLTFTKYKGYDPEIGAPSTTLSLGVDNGYYPQPRIVTAGINFGL